MQINKVSKWNNYSDGRSKANHNHQVRKRVIGTKNNLFRYRSNLNDRNYLDDEGCEKKKYKAFFVVLAYAFVKPNTVMI